MNHLPVFLAAALGTLVITWTTFVRVSFGFSLARCIEKLRDAKQSAGIADPADSRLQRLIIRFLGQWLQA